MEYDNIVVYGHPGSKFQHIQNLINENISIKIKEVKLYNHKNLSIESNTLYIYVDRRFRNVILTLYNMRHEFDISDDISFEEFYTTRYSKMRATGFFKDVNMAPRTFWEEFSNTWIKLSNKYNNIIVCFYDKIINNKEREIEKIKDKLYGGW